MDLKHPFTLFVVDPYARFWFPRFFKWLLLITRSASRIWRAWAWNNTSVSRLDQSPASIREPPAADCCPPNGWHHNDPWWLFDHRGRRDSVKDDDWTFGWLTRVYVAGLCTCLRSLQCLLWKLAEVRELKTRSLMAVLFHVYATADQSGIFKNNNNADIIMWWF